MIYRIDITNPERSILKWWPQVDWLKGREVIEFSPGLNVLCGPAGSGKSTVIKTIAKSLCCLDGGVQLVGQYTTLDHYTNLLEPTLLDGTMPVHDGSPILHFDPSVQVGVSGSQMDYDFGLEALHSTMFRGSGGETCLQRMSAALEASLEDKWREVVWKIHKDRKPDLAKRLDGDGTRVRPTLLLDEPSSNLDLRTEIRLMSLIQEIADSGVQVIMATHSVFALHFEGANYIDTTEGYTKRSAIDAEAHFLKVLLRDPKRMNSMAKALGELEEAQ
jgi:predicted ATPase